MFISFLTCAFVFSFAAQEEGTEVIRPRSVEGEGIFNNNVKLLIDGQSPPEGSAWDSLHTVYWEDTDTYFLLDLGGAFQITGILIQVDGNDDYTIAFSEEGDEYIPFIQILEAHGDIVSGMDTISSLPTDPHYVPDLAFEPISARFVRVYATGGDGRYSLSEIQVFGFRLESSGGAAGEEDRIIRPVGIEVSGDVNNSADLVVDGRIPNEESDWNGPESVFWLDVGTSFLIDLGDVYEISGFVVQVDTDDDYRLEYSLTGDDYIPLMDIVRDDGEVDKGMDTMSSIPSHPDFVSELEFFPVQARFIRLYALEGNGEFAVSEVQFFGRRPSR